MPYLSGRRPSRPSLRDGTSGGQIKLRPIIPHPEVRAPHPSKDAARESLPRLQPRSDLVHQGVAQPGMLDALDRFADEGLDQERLGFLCRNAARLEIKQKVIVERAGGRAMAALDIVGVDFQFRLAVG